MYRSMITDMDRQIGSLLRNLKALRIEEHTLVVFLSDNGPEEAAG
jgi:arylsulfatase A-like enzyme